LELGKALLGSRGDLSLFIHCAVRQGPHVPKCILKVKFFEAVSVTLNWSGKVRNIFIGVILGLDAELKFLGPTNSALQIGYQKRDIPFDLGIKYSIHVCDWRPHPFIYN